MALDLLDHVLVVLVDLVNALVGVVPALFRGQLHVLVLRESVLRALA